MSEADIAAARITPGFAALREFEIERIEAYFRSARIGVRRLLTRPLIHLLQEISKRG